MEFVPAYKLECGLRLGTTRLVTLARLHQWRTYEGLDGVPNHTFNDWHLEGDLRQARSLTHFDPLLIPPVRRSYHAVAGDMDGVRTVGGEPAEFLPAVTCLGVFQDVFPARDPDRFFSYLAVLWYQNSFAMPIDSETLESIRSVDWERFASDVD